MEATMTERGLADVCVDCGETVLPAYHVHDGVWEAALLAEDSACCLGCLTGRLGRQLSKEDFDLSSPVNFFLPGCSISAGVLSKFFEERGWPAHDIKRALKSFRRERRRHPEGLTLRQCVAWIGKFGCRVVVLADQQHGPEAE